MKHMIFTELLLQSLQRDPATLVNLNSDMFIIIKPKGELTEIDHFYG